MEHKQEIRIRADQISTPEPESSSYTKHSKWTFKYNVNNTHTLMLLYTRLLGLENIDDYQHSIPDLYLRSELAATI